MKKLLMTGLAVTSLFALSACGSEESTTIVVYSNAINTGYMDTAVEEASKAGFDIEIVHDGGLALTNKMILEKEAPVADVIFGPTMKDMIRLENEDALGDFNPSWGNKIPSDMQRDGLYYSLTLQPMLMVYNKDRVDDTTEFPTSWDDLTQSGDYNDAYTLWNSGGATASTLYSSFLMDYKDADGEYGISDEGWAAMDNYVNNGHANTPNTYEVMTYLTSDNTPDYVYAQLWGAGVTDYGAQYGIDFGVADVLDGWEDETPLVNEVIGISNKSRSETQEENVQEFAEWLGSSEFMVKWANTIGSAPANPDIAAEITGEGSLALLDIIDNITIQTLDMDLWVKQSDNWGAKVIIDFGYEA